MRILLLNTNYASPQLGGGQRSVQLLAERLLDQRHTVTVVSLTADRDSKVEMIRGVRVYRVPLANLYWPFGRQRRLGPTKLMWHAVDAYNMVMRERVRRIVDRERPDVAHTNVLLGFSVAVWDAFAAMQVPVVHTLRDYYLQCVRTTMYWRDSVCERPCKSCAFHATLRRRVAARVSYVVGISDAILTKHKRLRYFDGTPSEVIYNGVELPDSHLSNPPRVVGSSKFLRVGYLGRLHESKGVELLLNAARLVQRPIEVVVGGDGGEEYQRVLHQQYASEQVRFLGKVDAGSFLSSIDVLVVPSLWEEPMGRVVIEAYAHGRPVIVTSRGALTELVVHGQTGWVFDPTRPDALARILEHLDSHRSELKRMSDQARQRVELYSVRKMADAYVRVYASVLS